MLCSVFRYAFVALLLAGSATLLFSCEQETVEETSQDETMMTEYSEHLTLVKSQNGRKSYHFTTPLLEGYLLAKDPYREFRKGVKIVTYKDDSLASENSTLTANYAIYYEKRNLWEAKGNVVVTNSEGRTLYTQQLFWNAKTKQIYSNVDSKIVQNEGRDVFYGEGFESDEAMRDWRFRRMTGRMEWEQSQAADSVAATGAKNGAPTVAPKPMQTTAPTTAAELETKNSSEQRRATSPQLINALTGKPIEGTEPKSKSIFEKKRRVE